MSGYRLHLLDSSGHTTLTVALECPSDREAMAEVRGRNDPQAAELWLRGRRIAAFPADYAPSPLVRPVVGAPVPKGAEHAG